MKNKILKYAKKIMAINYLGGQCISCGEKEFFKLTFHHRNVNEKEFEFSNQRWMRWSLLKIELDKCDLLCQNCHRELHYNLKDNERRQEKLTYLKYSGGSCVKCGYDKCPAAITFHHKDPNEKYFSIGNLSERINSVDELTERIKSEIEKCELLCANCHVMEHSDLIFFNKNKKIIEENCLNHKEKQPKIDRDEVYSMYLKGMKQKEIATHFKSSKGTISDIIKTWRGTQVGEGGSLLNC